LIDIPTKEKIKTVFTYKIGNYITALSIYIEGLEIYSWLGIAPMNYQWKHCQVLGLLIHL